MTQANFRTRSCGSSGIFRINWTISGLLNPKKRATELSRVFTTKNGLSQARSVAMFRWHIVLSYVIICCQRIQQGGLLLLSIQQLSFQLEILWAPSTSSFSGHRKLCPTPLGHYWSQTTHRIRTWQVGLGSPGRSQPSLPKTSILEGWYGRTLNPYCGW